MSYYIERKSVRASQWTRFADRGFKNRPSNHEVHMVTDDDGYHWWIADPFPEVDGAYKAIVAFYQEHTGSVSIVRITDDEGRVFAEGTVAQWRERTVSIFDCLSINPPQEVHSMAEVPAQPLHVNKDRLLARLQERKAEEEKARSDAAEAVKARRQAAQDAVATLDSDEMLNLVQKYVNNNLDDIVEMIKDAKASGRLKSAEVKPNATETAIDKWVRVLEMSDDTTIEVAPSDYIYPLL